MSWDELFLRMAELVAQKSKDPSTKTGCVVVDRDHRVRSIGYNGFPAGVMDTPERYADRDWKYRAIVHADTNAICSAARVGVSLVGCVMYLTGPPCSDCTKAIIQAGIRVVAWPRDNPFETDPARLERWRESFEIAEVLAREAGMTFRRVEATWKT